ncbi:prolactin receptor [Pleuronectes platessa]|uniref:prolactin receptor n=1 Tax=Pleuronectes platessa TaxID=8262 RepID=UPI00232A6B56|nr:prolactin receptor [Pleuronectes platessa]
MWTGVDGGAAWCRQQGLEPVSPGGQVAVEEGTRHPMETLWSKSALRSVGVGRSSESVKAELGCQSCEQDLPGLTPPPGPGPGPGPGPDPVRAPSVCSRFFYLVAGRRPACRSSSEPLGNIQEPEVRGQVIGNEASSSVVGHMTGLLAVLRSEVTSCSDTAVFVYLVSKDKAAISEKLGQTLRLRHRPGAGRMLLLLCLLPLVSGSTTLNATHRAGHHHGEEDAVMTRPHIYHCRSPNMEDFTCWWRPLDNLTEGEVVSYVLTYSKECECPDYTSTGPNSCHFDSSHTSIWKFYCMNVTAVTAHGNYTSQKHCLDVADIVQTEAPVNVTYTLTDPGGDEMGLNVLLSWTYPVPAHLQYGWITLMYELQYRRLTEPDNWKVKAALREPHVELLGLPVADYVIRVRCRSQNYGLWSEWSSTLQMSIPPTLPAGKLLVLILVTGVGVLALLVIAFGVIPQSRRIKDYFLPQIPKPRIMGIDPLLMKKGNLDEINRHLSNFHSYRPPSYTEEVWDPVAVDNRG